MNVDINTFIRSICEYLNIDEPGIKTGFTFRSNTQIAAADLKQYRILIKDRPQDNDYYFAIAHELRHLWQYKNGWDLDQAAPGDIDKNEYNLQPAEVDAQAFAAIIMINTFHIEPLFIGLSADVKQAIRKRMDEITKEDNK